MAGKIGILIADDLLWFQSFVDRVIKGFVLMKYLLLRIIVNISVHIAI